MNKNSVQEKSHTTIHRSATQELRLSFLCPHHRDWVYFNSQQALEELDQIQMKGEILLEHQRWSRALPQLGSAWEITDILLQLYSGETTFLVNRLCCLCVLLSNCMQRMGHEECASKVILQTRQMLSALAQQLEPENAHRGYLMQCIDQIDAQRKIPDETQQHLLQRLHDATSNFLH